MFCDAFDFRDMPLSSESASGHVRQFRRYRSMAARHPTAEESSVPPGEPPDENNASVASESHCAALCRNILTIIPLPTDHEVAAKHFGKTNSFMKSYQNQMLRPGADGLWGSGRFAVLLSAEHFVETN
jgi:hypothetical protein